MNGRVRTVRSRRAAPEPAARAVAFQPYLDAGLKDSKARAAFEAGDAAWDIALQQAELRRARGLTQHAVAVRSGLKQPSVARLESKPGMNVELDTLRRVATALDAVPRFFYVPRERQAAFDAAVAKVLARRGNGVPAPARAKR